MASTCVLLIVLVVTCVGAEDAQNAFVKVVCNPQNLGQHGQPSLLDCVVQTSREVLVAEIQTLSWRKEGVEKPLLVFHQGKVTPQPGYGMARPSWNGKDMNVSLLIANATLADAGDYVCTVMAKGGDGELQTSLRVTAKYSEPVIRSVPEKITGNAATALTCEVDGGYPEGTIRWFVQDKTDWTKSSKMEARKAQSGLFHLSSTLTLSRLSIFSKYTCVVYNATGGKEAESVFNFDDRPESEGQEGKDSDAATKYVAPAVVIGSLIVGLLCVSMVLLYRRRSRGYPHQEVCHCEPDVVLDVEKGPDTSQDGS